MPARTAEIACRRRINAKNSRERKNPTPLPYGAAVFYVCSDFRHDHGDYDAKKSARQARRFGRRMAERVEQRIYDEVFDAFAGR